MVFAEEKKEGEVGDRATKPVVVSSNSAKVDAAAAASNTTTDATASSPSTTTTTNLISKAISKRVCERMNTEHGVTVFGMSKLVLKIPASTQGQNEEWAVVQGKATKVPAWHIHRAALHSIHTTHCTIDVHLACGSTSTSTSTDKNKDDGDDEDEVLSETKRIEYAFEGPPLTLENTESEILERFQNEVHPVVCAPHIKWLYTKPVLSLFFVDLASMFVVAGFFKYTLETIGLEYNPYYQKVFGDDIENISRSIFLQFGVPAVYICFMKHIMEAIYATYHAVQTLHLRPLSIITWFVLICIAGYPITSEFIDLLKYHWKSIGGGSNGGAQTTTGANKVLRAKTKRI